MKNKKTNLLSQICWVTYCRSFIFTIGVAFFAVSAFAITREVEKFKELPLWAICVISAMAILGISLVCVSFFAKNDRVEKWANDAGRGGLEVILLMAIAIPVYCFATIIKPNKKIHK